MAGLVVSSGSGCRLPGQPPAHASGRQGGGAARRPASHEFQGLPTHIQAMAVAHPHPPVAASAPDPACLPLLADALHRRRAVQILYDDVWRVVHPHEIGRTAKGKLALLAWQTAGIGRSAEPEGWRLFDLGRVSAMEVLQATFGPRPHPAAGHWTAGIRKTIAAL